jgi:hypothetical protein
MTVFIERLTSSWSNKNSLSSDMIQHLKLWPAPVTVVDDLVDDVDLLRELRAEPTETLQVAGLNATIRNVDMNRMTDGEQKILGIVSSVITAHCVENDIDCENIELSNFIKSYVYEYNEQSVNNNSYEPHHDMVEGNFITACFYLDSAWDQGTWCGGELALYRETTFATYPSNTINIIPKPNRLAIFPGFMLHRVKPYFGKKPRTTLVFAWSLPDAFDHKPIII